jgi:carboxylesterase type B
MVDGDILRSSPSFAYDHNPPLVAPIDMLLGCNSDEGMSAALGAQVVVENTAFFAYILTALLGFNDTMLAEALALWPEDAQYPPYSEPMSIDWPALTATVGVASGNQTRRLYGFINDVVIHVGRRYTAQNWAKVTGKSAYSYRWDVDPSRIPRVYTPGLGVGFAQHGADVSFQFGIPEYYPQQYPISIPIPDVPAMRNVSYAMQAHFIAFAVTGDPNAHHVGRIPKWSAYTDREQKNFVYNATLQNMLNLHVEDDDYRADQLQWVNERWCRIS